LGVFLNSFFKTKHAKYPSLILRLNIAFDVNIQRQEKTNKKKHMHITHRRNKETKLKVQKITLSCLITSASFRSLARPYSS